MTISEGDLSAIAVVLSQLATEADEMPLDRAVALRDVLDEVASELKGATNQLETNIKRQLEQPKVIGKRKYSVEKKGTIRYRHDEIARLVLERVKHDYAREHDGLIPDPVPLTMAWRAFATIYLSNSTTAKQAALRSLLGIPDVFDAHVARWDASGGKTEIKSIELEDL